MGIVQTSFMGLALGICYIKLKKRLCSMMLELLDLFAQLVLYNLKIWTNTYIYRLVYRIVNYRAHTIIFERSHKVTLI